MLNKLENILELMMIKCFAWFPVKTVDGKFKWLTLVNRKWNNDLNVWGYDGYSGEDGGWEYHGVEE